MPEQQKIDETIESATLRDNKKLTIVDHSSISLEKDQFSSLETEPYDDEDRILETKDEYFTE